MARKYETAKETEQAGFENTGFNNSGFEKNVDRGGTRPSLDGKRKEDSPDKMQGDFENSSFGFSGRAGRGNFQNRQQNQNDWDKNAGNRTQHGRNSSDSRSRNPINALGKTDRQSFNPGFRNVERNPKSRDDNRSRNRLYSKSPERNQAASYNSLAFRSFNDKPDGDSRSHHKSSIRDTPLVNSSGYRKQSHAESMSNPSYSHGITSKDKSASNNKFNSSRFKRSSASISYYRDGHDNRQSSPDRKQSRQQISEQSNDHWGHDKFRESLNKDTSKKLSGRESTNVFENRGFES